MKKVKPIPAAHHYKCSAFLFKDLISCTHVFMRHDAVKRALEKPYSGPHKVLKRDSDRVYTIEILGQPSKISVERLKPAFMETTEIINPMPRPGTSQSTTL